ncbi:RPM1-interacting protein [Musa troglodytarum]|uniref:RPM1-interacting protein n=1 Tax=Musa troglodytarum TaxID=320322 RepID=A0A9E7H202_9LILI|nr:RPM1-interacting protein [Musa troglodytarum]
MGACRSAKSRNRYFSPRRKETRSTEVKRRRLLAFRGISVFRLFGKRVQEMSQHTHIPKFGNWGSDGDLNYSQFFDKALRERSELNAKKMNHRYDNPDAFDTEVPTVHGPSLGTSPYSIANGVLHLRGEDGIHQLNDSPFHRNSMADKLTLDSLHQTTSGDYQRTGRVCDGSDYRVDHSPTHPNYQMKISAYSSSEGSSGGNRAITLSSAGKLRMTGVQYDEIVSKGSAIPKFGDWDESDPSTADGYSRIFNNVREGKQRVSAEVSQVSSDKTYDKDHESNHEPSVCGFIYSYAYVCH